MNKLPLFYYPSTWIWVDDDPLILESMAFVFGQHNQVKTFQSAKACLSFLETYEQPLARHGFLRSEIENERYGILQHAPVDFDVTSIAELATDKNRRNEITVMVIDYQLPEINGLSLAKSCQSFPMQKVLLTGATRPEQAIASFNANLIDRFIQKGDLDVAEKLSTYLRQLTLQYFQTKTSPLLSHLEAEKPLPLSDPTFVNFFEQFCKENQINEYYLINKQGSFLCTDILNQSFCLVVYSERDVVEWLHSINDVSGLNSKELTLVREYKKIPFFGIRKEHWQVEPSQWSKHFYAPEILEGRERYLWTKIPCTPENEFM